MVFFLAATRISKIIWLNIVVFNDNFASSLLLLLFVLLELFKIRLRVYLHVRSAITRRVALTVFLMSWYFMPHKFFKAILASLGQVALSFVLIDNRNQESFTAVPALCLLLAHL